ncbi:hypothetical protein TNCV_4685441 [Trichonephila clavipes]|nr:hypothetical protein TNCV_4685441 [Trichonephila clavipes]
MEFLSAASRSLFFNHHYNGCTFSVCLSVVGMLWVIVVDSSDCRSDWRSHHFDDNCFRAGELPGVTLDCLGAELCELAFSAPEITPYMP